MKEKWSISVFFAQKSTILGYMVETIGVSTPLYIVSTPTAKALYIAVFQNCHQFGNILLQKYHRTDNLFTFYFNFNRKNEIKKEPDQVGLLRHSSNSRMKRMRWFFCDVSHMAELRPTLYPEYAE